MKLLHGIAFVSAMATLAAGFSFSEITAAQSAPSNGRNDVTDVTSDEESRMFGGSNADNKKHPYVAELLAKSITDERFCGGTLIAPQYVLTAVSCLAWLPFDMHVSLGGKKRAKVGALGRRSKFASWRLTVIRCSTRRGCRTTWRCSSSRSRPLTNQLVCVTRTGRTTSLARWLLSSGGGDVSEKGTAETFQSVDVKIISVDECGKYARNTDFTFCTTGKGFCDGDTGGPLIANGVVVGTCIASMLPGDAGDCGDRHSLYARVSHVLDYISDIVNGGSTGNDTDSIMQKTQ